MLVSDMNDVVTKVTKLQERIERFPKTPDPQDLQSTRLLIRALTESISKIRGISASPSRKIRQSSLPSLQADWQELVEMLVKKGIQTE